PGAVGRRSLRDERARDRNDEEREEGRNRGEDRNDPDDEVTRPGPIQADRRRAEARQDQQPEQQRPFLTSPERRDRVRGRQRYARRPRDVREREVVAEKR